jgi:S1-C subfamily serine protease
MKPARIISVVLMAALLLATLGGDSSLALDRTQRTAIIQASVEIMPLKIEGGKVVDIPWTGSGTIVDATGLILTNYHVVQETGDWDALGILVTTRSDSPPEPVYLAEIAAKAPHLDLAVLRVVSDLNGDPVDPQRLNLPYVKLGDADVLEIGDELNIFGYPGIGGSTITFTQGRVSGFTPEEGVDYQRAWIKTDASISGGNSGGTGVDEAGALVGIPTQAGSGNADYFVDVRPVQDTNGDGVVDENDTPVALGGFINALRPVNLAYPLIEAAKSGKQVQGTPSKGSKATKPAPSRTSGPSFSEITFASRQNADGSPLDSGTQFPADVTKELFAYFDYQGMTDGMEFNYAWTLDGATAYSESVDWEWGQLGTFYLNLHNEGDPMPEGEYQLTLGLAGEVLQQGTVTVGQAAQPGARPVSTQDTGVTIYGTIVNADTGAGIPGAFIVVLQPGVTTRQFLHDQKDEQVAGFGQTDQDGAYVILPPLPRNNSYGVIIGAEGYELIEADDGFEIGSDVPDTVELDPIALSAN